ncbi:MAG: hypothetical protein FJX55_18325, partial [Alphaproteobacteria bacterium]|nr:hypothetical protein [Alphaproteobacteria bacterium]
LPAAERAVVDDRKITDYLLSAAHPAGRAKAAFFRGFGFSIDRWAILRAAILEHARTAAIVEAIDTPYGRKYVIEGPMTAPDGRAPAVRAVWFIGKGEAAPRFVTAYQGRGGQ